MGGQHSGVQAGLRGGKSDSRPARPLPSARPPSAPPHFSSGAHIEFRGALGISRNNPRGLCGDPSCRAARHGAPDCRVKGKAVDEVLTIKNSDIAKHLSLPPVKLHCSMLAEDAIKAAVKDWRAKQAKNGGQQQQAASAAASA